MVAIINGNFVMNAQLNITIDMKDGRWRSLDIPLDQELDISKTLESLTSSNTETTLMKGEEGIERPMPQDEIELQGKLIVWLMNVILYMSSSESRQELQPTNKEYQTLTTRLVKAKGTTREKIKERRRSLDPGYRIFLGADIKMPIAEASLGTSLSVRTLVSGHWRNQSCGPNHSLRKHIWIQPFWRGADDAPVTAPIRVLH